MNIKSKQFIFALLVGITAGLLITVFYGQIGWGAIIGAIAAARLANVSTPKEGAVVGAITILTIEIYATILAAIQTNGLNNHGLFATLTLFFISLLKITGIGALYGLVIGKLFQFTKDKILIF
jgi:hypothetical protein